MGKDKPKSQDELDAELTAYMLKDKDAGKSKLDSDLDDYWKHKDSKKGADAEAEAEADGENGEAEVMDE